jgi:hypothetical protein
LTVVQADTLAAERALGEIGRHRGPVLIDLDHTLLSGNSTDAFIRSARPRLLVAMIVRLIEFLAPWRFLPAQGDKTTAWRDVIRLYLVTGIDRSALRRWREGDASKLRKYLHAGLADAAARDDARVVTLGFDRIVSPIFAGSDKPVRIIAMPWLDPRARDRGKLARLREELGDDVIARSLLVTDNLKADADVASAAERVVAWPAGDDAGSAHPGVYYPFRYADEVKKAPSRLHTIRQIFLLLFPLTFISTHGVGTDFLNVAPLLLAVAASFFCIYEIGYVENDVLASKLEEKPVIPSGHARWEIEEIAVTAWAFAGLALIAGVAYAALALGETPMQTSALAARWLVFLAASRLVFAGFNRRRPRARVPWFFGLHVLKVVGPLAVVLEPASAVGWALILSHLIATTAPYASYRWSATPYRYHYTEARRLLIFAGALTMLVATGGLAATTIPAAAMGLAWSLFVARKDLARLARAVLATGRTGDSDPA